MKARLLAAGYVESGTNALTRPMAEFDSGFSYRDSIVHYASPARLIGWVSALQ